MDANDTANLQPAKPARSYPKTVLTHWELWTYDVWGNARDGYEVNDRSCFARDYKIRAKVKVSNAGTPREFARAHPSDYQLAKAFGYGGQPDIDGDGEHIYITSAAGYPLGEAHLIEPDTLKVQPETDKPTDYDIMQHDNGNFYAVSGKRQWGPFPSEAALRAAMD